MRIYKQRRLVVILICLLPLFAAPVLATTIYVGDIGNQPADQIRKSSPFVNYLVKNLHSEGIDQGKVVVVRSIPDMAAALREGKVDLFIDSPFPVLAVSRLSGAKILLRRWKSGVAEYRSVIFVRNDSAINRLEELRGKMVAFEERFSTMSYFVPKLAMVQKGLKLTEKRDASDPVASGEVGYVFVGDEPNTMIWVLKGRASAGVMSEQSYKLEARGSVGQLKVIHETFTVPRHIVAYRADLPPKLVAKIRDILIRMDQSDEGRKVLKQFENTTKFDEIPEQSMTHLLKSLPLTEAELGMR